MKKLLFFATIFFLISCNNKEPKSTVVAGVLSPLSKNANNNSFNQSFAKLLNDYYLLKDNFIKENDTLITFYAQQLKLDADSLKVGELHADSAIVLTAKSSAEGISGELVGLLGEKGLEAKRKSLYTLSEELYDLIRTVQYSQEVVYHYHCPMAFNEAGANWLSNSFEIRNPYIPKKLLDCGELIDSLDFSTIK